MEIEVIPTVLAFSKRSFDSRFKKIIKISDTIQIDLMDGRFVPTKSITLDQVPSVKRYKKKFFEAHLMIKEPIRWVSFLVDKGFKRFILHYETLWEEDIPLIREFMDREKVEWVLAINPETPVSKAVKFAKYTDGILVMGVHPGKNGAPYDHNLPKRIRELARKIPRNKIIQVDGGMNDMTIRSAVKAGARRINTGHYVTSARDPARALAELKAAGGGA